MTQHEYRTTWERIGNIAAHTPDPIVPSEPGTWVFLGMAANADFIFWTWMKLPDKALFAARRGEGDDKP